jgi:L-threonylcarbamoyladenylate synthase
MATGLRLLPALQALASGGVVAYPTEAVYGLGCNPFDESAVASLLAIKGRAARKGLILIAADQTQLLPLLRPLPPEWQDRLNATWPGPVTWLLPVADWVPDWLTGGRNTLAVRVTDHPIAAALCHAWGGPLVSTSANRSGLPAARTALQVRSRLGQAVDAVVPGPTGNRQQPSEIRDMASGRIIRPGG